MAAPDKEEKKEEKEAKAEPKPTSSGSKLVVPLLGLNTLLLVGVLAVQLLRPQLGAHPAAKVEEAAASSSSHEEEKPADKAAEKEHEKPAEAAADKASEKAPDKAKPAREVALPGPTMRLPDFVVHLRDMDSERYARMAFEIELTSELDKEKVQAHMPRVRDSFLTFLSDRTVSDLRGAESIARIKQALLEKLKELVPQVTIRALYITDLVIQ